MNLERVLENWEDYDKKKKKGVDARYFSCSEQWEIDYLTEKIVIVFPKQMPDRIRRAISSCCEIVPAPRLRRKFVECVLRRLRLI